MDLGIIIGIVLGVASILISVILDGGHLSSLLNVPALLIIFGGSIGATMIGTSLKEILKLPTLLKKALFEEHPIDPETLITTLVRFAQKARKEGLLTLEEELSKRDLHPFLVKGLQLVIDGVDEEGIRNILQTEIESMRHRHQIGFEVFEMMGGYAPTMGLIGAVLGLIHVLGNLGGEGGAEELGRGIATAFVATLYGVFSANMLFLPLAGNLKAKSEEEAFLYKVMIEGIIGIQQGQNPRILEQKLLSFFPASVKGKE